MLTSINGRLFFHGIQEMNAVDQYFRIRHKQRKYPSFRREAQTVFHFMIRHVGRSDKSRDKILACFIYKQ